MRYQSIEFILVYEAFLVTLQETYTTYHMTQVASLFGESDRTETQNYVSLPIDAFRRISKGCVPGMDMVKISSKFA